ncbi:hypothetical protein CH92_05685 [Stutzerimonas stutzeri]|uniref:Beta family protein n=1 Tax=Stutzerimonas stutzeri TaxID=316 RepID=W8R539_STUST|nr:beta family protein [Stutzerimonas stutzeri]AHL74613.1 hypothetical protein CH92_05685 [Stutzerimonas stutzeri]MCQ4329143.1 beta family protein [Stutzerimonas stutzeri]
MDWTNFWYFPVLKTKDSELRGMGNIPNSVLKNVLPIYEITRSRLSKNNPLGDISKRIDQIGEIQGNSPFILDVTTDPKQQNLQIESILTPNNGYYCWREVLNSYPGLKICPAIHIDLDLDPTLDQTKLFVKEMARSVERMALRLPTGLDESDYNFIVESVRVNLGNAKLYLLLDDGCIRANVKSVGIQAIADDYSNAYKALLKKPGIKDYVESFVCIAGSFPQSVKDETGEDEHGSFSICEHELYKLLSAKHPALRFGDYAAVNINQIEMRGGTFIPRIDFCTDDRFYYYRYRRNSGSYFECAKKVVKDPLYQTQGTWGDDEILSASKNKPSGISPSFWISVRINNYIVRRVSVLSL